MQNLIYKVLIWSIIDKEIKNYLYVSFKTVSMAYTYTAVFNYFNIFQIWDHTTQHSLTVSSHGTQETWRSILQKH
jgi:hypothetical protein